MKKWALQRGFTIVELLIVIVVIAILAAITIVAYTGIQNRAKDSALQSAISQQAKKLAVSKVTNGDLYPADLASARSQGALVDANGVTYTAYIVSGDRTNYCATAQATDGSKYSMSSTATAPIAGECVTNLATDPAATQWVTVANPNTAGWNNGRWFGTVGTAVGSYTLRTGMSDGPTDSLKTYASKVWTATSSAAGDFGYAHGNGVTTNTTTIGLALDPSSQYTLSSYLRINQAYNGANIGVYWHDASGVYISTSVSSNVVLSNGQWRRLSFTVTSPSNAATGGVLSDLDGQTVNANAALDGTGLMITKGANLYSYGDGNSVGWFWNGTPNNSTSVGPAVAQ